jgi:molybdate transport system substrate-binding protein
MAAMKKMLILLLGVLLALPLQAQPLLVAAASDLGYCIDALAAAFRQQVPGAQVKVSLGASGHFYAQIRHGAPFDVFLSADMGYPAQLAKLGVADPASLTPYAIGRIALWSLDPRFDPARGLALLRDPGITRVAIANPSIAPYGRAARAALERAGLWQALQPKLVIGENIAQTAQFVQSGNAQVGIVSLALLRAPNANAGRYYLIPDTGLAPIEQGAIVTRHGAGNPLAPRFVQFMGSPAARAILERHGFGLPRKPAHD